jgi:hypothetical protein
MKKKGNSARLAAEGLPLIHGASPQHDGLWQSRKIIFIVILPDTSIIKESASPKDSRHPFTSGGGIYSAAYYILTYRLLLSMDVATTIDPSVYSDRLSPSQSIQAPLILPNNISRKCHHITLVQGFRSVNP